MVEDWPRPDPRLPIGIIVLNRERQERVVQVIPADTVLPFTYRSRFGYAYEKMTAVRVEVTVGPGTTRQEVRMLGKLEVTHLPPRKRGSPLELVLEHRGDELVLRLIDVEAGVSKEVVLRLAP